MIPLNKKRWLFAANGLSTMFCLNMINNWSVFVEPLETKFGWVRSQTRMTFSIVIITFSIGGLLGGLMLRKLPSLAVMCLSAALIASGFFLSSFISAPWQLYLSYGVAGGTGIGMAYNATMNATVKWFPDKQGLVSGILLMSYGFGGALWGSAAVFLMSRLEWDNTFRVLGILLPLIIIVLAFFMRSPTTQQRQFFVKQIKSRLPGGAEDYPPSATLKERSFWAFFIWAILINSAGFSLFNHAAPMSSLFANNAMIGGYLSGLVHVFNGGGRFTFGYLLDLTGSKRCMQIITAGLAGAVVILISAFFSGSLPLLIAGFILGGFAFGGLTPSSSAFAIKVFGQKYYSVNYSLINLSGLVSALLGPYVTGVILTRTGDYIPMLIIMASFCVLGIPAIFLINRHAVGK
jgi:OFA family oxalate/formate antiporter-like MFS transporter